MDLSAEELIDAAVAAEPKTPPPPRANPNKLELATGARVFQQWFYRTHHDLDEVLSPGYFNTAWQHGLTAHDRIAVVALDGDPDGAEYSDLVVVADKYRPAKPDRDDPGLDIRVAELR